MRGEAAGHAPTPYHCRARSARAPGARWATEDSAGPRPAPRAPGLSRRPARCFSCGNVQIRGCGRSARSARGGRPLPSRKDAPPRMRSLYRYTLCKRNVQQRADTARPPVAPVFDWGFEGRSGSVGAAGRPAERAFSAAGVRNSFLSAAGESPLSDRWTGPGGTRTDEPREKASFPGVRGPQGPGARGGAPQLMAESGLVPTPSLVSITFNTLRQTSVGESVLRRASLGSLSAETNDSYLVDPASSHMLVSKIKPCMSKYNLYTGKLRMAH